LGTERFQGSFPELAGMDELVKGRMDEQRASIKETMERCGMDTAAFEEEEGLTKEAEE